MRNLLMLMLVLGLIGSASADLIAYWSMDEAAGSATLADGAGGDNNVTVNTSNVITGVAGKFGSAVQQTGIGEQNMTALDTGMPYGQSDISISLWFKGTAGALSTKKILFSYGNSALGEMTALDFGQDGATNIRAWHYGADMTSTAVALTADTWHLFTYTMDFTAQKQKIYFDGVLVTTQTTNTANPINVQPDSVAPGSLEIGGWERTNGDYSPYAFLGMFDDVAVWNHVLTADDAAALWNNGDGNPVSILMRGMAHDPNPDGSVSLAAGSVPDPLTWMSPDNPNDPNITSVTGYDVYFYGVPVGSVGADDPNFVGITPVSVSSESIAQNLLPETITDDMTYFWRVDSDVVWDANEITGNYSDTMEGLAWSFTTLPANPAPIVNAGDDIVTAMEFLPATLAGTVTDPAIDRVEWDIVGHPGAPVDDVATTWTRTQTQTYEPELLLDQIGTDERRQGNPMRVILSGLPAGDYTWKSYHHDTVDLYGPFDVYINDDNGQTVYEGYAISLGDLPEAEITTVEATIKANGNDDVVVIFDQNPDDSTVVYDRLFVLNGFELVSTAGSLDIDCGPEGSTVKAGFQAYEGVTKNLDSFVPTTYSAFGGTDNITMDIEWGGYAIGWGPDMTVTNTTTNLATPTATLTTDTPGTYTVKLTAWDSIDQDGSDTMIVTVGADACAAAQLSSHWAGFNYYDTDEDCDVDLVDFSEFAKQWLDDKNLPSQE